MEPARDYSSHVRSPRVPGAVRFYLAFSAIVLILVAFEAFLTSLPFADAIPDYAEQLQQRQLDSYFEMIQLLITLATRDDRRDHRLRDQPRQHEGAVEPAASSRRRQLGAVRRLAVLRLSRVSAGRLDVEQRLLQSREPAHLDSHTSAVLELPRLRRRLRRLRLHEPAGDDARAARKSS